MSAASQQRVIYLDANGYASWTALLETIVQQGYTTAIFAFYMPAGQRTRP